MSNQRADLKVAPRAGLPQVRTPKAIRWLTIASDAFDSKRHFPKLANRDKHGRYASYRKSDTYKTLHARLSWETYRRVLEWWRW